jgi:hypothetical protein
MVQISHEIVSLNFLQLKISNFCEFFVVISVAVLKTFCHPWTIHMNLNKMQCKRTVDCEYTLYNTNMKETVTNMCGTHSK